MVPFRVAVAKTGAADDPKHYHYYDVPVPANDTFVATIGMMLGATDKIRVFAGNANLSFNLHGLKTT